MNYQKNKLKRLIQISLIASFAVVVSFLFLPLTQARGGSYNFQVQNGPNTSSTIMIDLSNYNGLQIDNMFYQVKLIQINGNIFTYMWNYGEENINLDWHGPFNVEKGQPTYLENNLGFLFRLEDPGYGVGNTWAIIINWNSGSQCGNMMCESGEDINNCRIDCAPPCGNGVCSPEFGENQNTCAFDCGGAVCGNNICDNGEPDSCPQDCLSQCGNGWCGPGENPMNCPNDCGSGSQCGNMMCEFGEDQNNCPQDCQQQNQCNYNFACEQGENSGNCPSDCGVQCGSIITTNTTLNSNLSCDTTALYIGADNVVLDCSGHTITHTGIGSGVEIGNHHYYITIKNCNIIGNTSIPFITVGNETVSTTVSYNIGISVWSENDNNNIINNTLSYNNMGIHIFDRSDNTIIANNTVNSNYDGIVLDDGINNTVTNNTISNNTREGIEIQHSQGNLIYNNFFNNTINTNFALPIYQNVWNTTKTPGINIVSGPNIGGNYWGNPLGAGYSERCTNTDRDGICDSAYTLATKQYRLSSSYLFGLHRC